MPLRTQTKFYSNFSGGLITEANPLFFPENTAKDISNVTLNRDGTAFRRLGMDTEDSATNSVDTFTEAEIQSWSISLHEWDAVDGDGTLEFIVVQIGSKLYIHDQASPTSGNILASLDFSDLGISDDFRNYQVDTTSGLGKLFVVGKYISPFYLAYDSTAGIFSATKLSLKIRDIDGLSEEDDTSGTITTEASMAFVENGGVTLQDDINVNPALVDFDITYYSSSDVTAYPG